MLIHNGMIYSVDMTLYHLRMKLKPKKNVLNSLEVRQKQLAEMFEILCVFFCLAEQLEQKTLDELDELEDEEDERVLQEYR